MFSTTYAVSSEILRKYFAIFFARAAWHKNGTRCDKSLLFNARRAIRNAQVVGSIPSVGSTLEGLRLLGCGPFLFGWWRLLVSAVCGGFWLVAAVFWHKNGTKLAAYVPGGRNSSHLASHCFDFLRM